MRFLSHIVQRTFEDILLQDATADVEVYEPQVIAKIPHDDFKEAVYRYAKDAYACGCMLLCIHVDADASDDKAARKHKIDPAFGYVQAHEAQDVCKELIAMIPVHMTEAWMLADTDLLRRELMAPGLPPFRPEQHADPKQILEKAIAEHCPPGRRGRSQVRISDLYGPIGQKISLKQLESLPSYKAFCEQVRDLLHQLNYIR